MVPSTTTDPWFLKGIEEFERGTEYELVLMWTSELKKATLHLEASSYYDGYIRRKYSLVDENGEEIRRRQYEQLKKEFGE